MTPQGHFTILAPITAGREAALQALLATMNAGPGMAEPGNPLVPFGLFAQLHFARFAILNDQTFGDIEAYGLPARQLPTYLALIGDCDGPAREFLSTLCAGAADGLRKIFSHCEGFDGQTELLSWVLWHDRPAAATYTNTLGRTVVQIREERRLQGALAERADRSGATGPGEPERRRLELAAWVRGEVHAGRLSLTPPAPTPWGWRLRGWAHAVLVPLVALLALPVLVLLLPWFAVKLRQLERTDPELCMPADRASLRAMQDIEDVDVTNQYTALGSLKPGGFRLAVIRVVLLGVEYFARHVFRSGYLARVQTIHFARWVFMDNGSRMVFTSNYDGGHEAYMDDFINKMGWGLNLVFSSGLGWPATDWLIRRGSRREHLFKYFQRRHQVPTAVWFKAYPGMTLAEMTRNHRIRQGLERDSMGDVDALAWLRLL